jgi:hypothetical protein
MRLRSFILVGTLFCLPPMRQEQLLHSILYSQRTFCRQFVQDAIAHRLPYWVLHLIQDVWQRFYTLAHPQWSGTGMKLLSYALAYGWTPTRPVEQPRVTCWRL